eukprot:GEMP01000288.1.p1 GENE.GEMP01000288.1~~GEMP01000288.1.p1  ORF type:complete len:601 (+),score=138.12 GEMP01000288.1:120-1922(+)
MFRDSIPKELCSSASQKYLYSPASQNEMHTLLLAQKRCQAYSEVLCLSTHTHALTATRVVSDTITHFSAADLGFSSCMQRESGVVRRKRDESPTSASSHDPIDDRGVWSSKRRRRNNDLADEARSVPTADMDQGDDVCCRSTDHDKGGNNDACALAKFGLLPVSCMMHIASFVLERTQRRFCGCQDGSILDVDCCRGTYTCVVPPTRKPIIALLLVRDRLVAITPREVLCYIAGPSDNSPTAHETPSNFIVHDNGLAHDTDVPFAAPTTTQEATQNGKGSYVLLGSVALPHRAPSGQKACIAGDRFIICGVGKRTVSIVDVVDLLLVRSLVAPFSSLTIVLATPTFILAKGDELVRCWFRAPPEMPRLAPRNDQWHFALAVENEENWLRNLGDDIRVDNNNNNDEEDDFFPGGRVFGTDVVWRDVRLHRACTLDMTLVSDKLVTMSFDEVRCFSMQFTLLWQLEIHWPSPLSFSSPIGLGAEESSIVILSAVKPRVCRMVVIDITDQQGKISSTEEFGFTPGCGVRAAPCYSTGVAAIGCDVFSSDCVVYCGRSITTMCKNNTVDTQPSPLVPDAAPSNAHTPANTPGMPAGDIILHLLP